MPAQGLVLTNNEAPFKNKQTLLHYLVCTPHQVDIQDRVTLRPFTTSALVAGPRPPLNQEPSRPVWVAGTRRAGSGHDSSCLGVLAATLLVGSKNPSFKSWGAMCRPLEFGTPPRKQS